MTVWSAGQYFDLISANFQYPALGLVILSLTVNRVHSGFKQTLRRSAMLSVMKARYGMYDLH